MPHDVWVEAKHESAVYSRMTSSFSALKAQWVDWCGEGRWRWAVMKGKHTGETLMDVVPGATLLEATEDNVYA